MNSIETLLNGNIAYAFAWTMIHSLWQCALVAITLAISLRITRHHRAELRYLQGLLALLICVIVSGITFFRYYNNILSIDQALLAFSTTLNVAYVGDLWENIYVTLNSVVHYIVLLWLFGFIVQFYRYSQDFVRAITLGGHGCEPVNNAWNKRFDRLAQRLDVAKKFTVKNSSRITSICTVGHIKPVILLPIGLLASLPTDQVEALVLHELAHIKRNDYLVNIVQCFVRLFYFFNPAVLWISSQIDVERENACDDIAVSHCGDPSLYADSLANISELELNLMTVMAAKKSKYQILSRVKRLFSNSSSLSKSMEQLISAMCACFVVAAMNVSAADFNILSGNNLQSPIIKESAKNPDVVPTIENAPVEQRAQNSMVLAAIKKPELASKITEQDSEQKPDAFVPSVVQPENANRVAADIKLKASPELDYAKTMCATRKKHSSKQRMHNIARAEDTAQEQKKSWSKLEPIEDSAFNTLLVANDFKLPLSRKIYVADAQLSFASDWKLKFSNKDSYQEDISKKYGQGLVDSLEESLMASGWEIMDTPGADVVRLEPRLFDVYITAPGSRGSKVYIVSSYGHAKIELIFKTPSNQPFMKIIDFGRVENKSGAEANRASNYRYFNKLMVSWSKTATAYLEYIMAVVENKKLRKTA